MFFDNESLAPRKGAVLKELPPVPHTGWERPKSFPNLVGNVRAVAFDVETREPDFDFGPGWSRGVGNIVGFSVGVVGFDGARGSWYFPVRHELGQQHNILPEAAFSWLKEVLETPTVPKIGANLIYDIGWLAEEGIEVQGELHDVQFAEALLTENSPTNLEHLGQKYCDEGKESSVLYDWCAKAYGGTPGQKQRSNIYRAPPELVGFYAESDVDLPIDIIEKQFPILREEGLLDLYRMECDLIPMLVAMRRTGVRVDLDKAEQLHGELSVDVQRMKEKFWTQVGFEASVDAPTDLGKVFDKFGLSYPLTKQTKMPSFKADWLEAHESPIAESILEIRRTEKICNTFLESYILKSHVNGRVHCQFHPLRARTGRASSSTPNLQNIPVRSDLGKQMRNIFLPDEGHVCWESADYSQIEYRMLAHFAVGRGSDAVRERYRNDPATDYHTMTQDLVYEVTGMKIGRKPIKSVNFGLLYGMMEGKLARQLGIVKEESGRLFSGYHAGNPYVKSTMNWASGIAEKFGYTQTILGRRRRFDLWEPSTNGMKKKDDRATPLLYNAAIAQYGSKICRAMTYIAINSILQGSAADYLKKAMLDCWKAGIFEVTGVPKLQVHDELNFSVIDHSPVQNEAYREMKHRMENALPTKVPMLLSRERGPTWGSTRLPEYSEASDQPPVRNPLFVD